MICRVGLWLAAVLAALLPLPAALVERYYSQSIFPPLQRCLTTVSNLVPMALFDIVIIGVTAGVLGLTIRDLSARRRQVRMIAIRLVMRLATVGAAAYLAFLVTWGLNYRREPITAHFRFDASLVTPDSAIALADESVRRVNALHDDAHRQIEVSTRIDSGLADAFTRLQPSLPGGSRFVPARPKRTLLDAYFRRAGVAGMTDPYWLETLVATDLLAVERPMVVAHEWSHLAGLADEGEASFAGWLTCMRGSALHQYSGWLFLYGEVAGGLGPADLRRVAVNLDEGPRADLQAIRDRLMAHLNPALSAAGWRVYDHYLKVNRVGEGTASYATVVRLVLGTEFEAPWIPRRR